ncbi:DUF1758 domain-containing protein [Trichonephila clavipes]|nr:DUF1758 domain-containing protein [Trichonephila clavipes]
MSPNKELDGRISYFLPHHAVRRKDSITTKFRVVFDGSCKPPNSNSLNSVLGVGQILQPDILTLLMLEDSTSESGVLILEMFQSISKNLEFNEPNVEIHPENCSKALGLIWDSKEDRFIFNMNFKFEGEITKRSFLSQSARLFDPLGFLSSCTISIKIFYQQLWLLKLNWDEALPEHLLLKWKKFQMEFQQVCHLSIPRWLKIANKKLALHGFSDASEAAYTCVVYVVQRDRETTKVVMLGGKSKVAPLKPICIPRLELNGALLLARFFETLCNCLKDHVINIYVWTDSQVVLSWLSSPPRNWKSFVANRTSEILDIIPCKQWRYVPSKENPADLGSRGMPPKDLPDCSLWWEGPQWLSSEEAWPKQPTIKDKRDIEKSVIIETKRTFVFSIYLGEEIIGPPETVEESKLTLKGRWDIVQKLKLNFWKRWQIDYLNSIQGRTKWKSGTSNIKIGDVIIKEDNLPPSVWPLGKVISTHPEPPVARSNNHIGTNLGIQTNDDLGGKIQGKMLVSKVTD